MAYPDDYSSFRATENVPGLTYDPDDKKTLFSEDFQALASAITNIEGWLGTSGDFKTAGFFGAIFDLLYPIGKIVAFNSEFDPDSEWPGSTWVKVGEGRVLVGQDTTDPDFDTLGETGGEKAVVLTEEQLPGHTHTTDNTLSFSRSDTTSTLDPGAVRVGANANRYNGSVQGLNAVTGTTGSNEAHNNLQPYYVVAYWERTA